MWRKRWDDQAHQPALESERNACNSVGQAFGPGSQLVVFSALRSIFTRRRGTCAVQPQLVQPCGSGARNGILYDDEYDEFMSSVVEFEHMLIRSGIKLLKY